MELILKLLEKLGELLTLRKNQKRALFEDHIEPIYSMAREVTDDYLRLFDETREQVADASISLKTIHKTLVSRRKKLELVRIELGRYSESFFDFKRNDQIAIFARRCIRLIEDNPIIDLPIFIRRYFTKATTIIKLIENVMDPGHSLSRDDLLRFIDLYIENIKEIWAEITDIYIILKKKMLK